MSRTIEVDLQPHHRRHREATVTVPLATAEDPAAADVAGLQATVETVPSSPVPTVRTSKTRPSRPATLVLPAEQRPINLNVNVNVPPPSTPLMPSQANVPLMNDGGALASAAQMHIAEYESVHGGAAANGEYVRIQALKQC